MMYALNGKLNGGRGIAFPKLSEILIWDIYDKNYCEICSKEQDLESS